jgi:hypothetical protein
MRIDQIATSASARAAHECGGGTVAATHGAVMLQQNLRVILLTASKRATD